VTFRTTLQVTTLEEKGGISIGTWMFIGFLFGLKLAECKEPPKHVISLLIEGTQGQPTLSTQEENEN
jgi:hypothetical protein